VLCGIGKVAAANTTALLAERFGVSAIVMTGVAGGLGPGVKVGDMVVAEALLQHDMDASPIFPRHEVPGYGRSRFASDAALTERLVGACEAILHDPRATLGEAALAAFGLQAPRVHRGLLVSGDRFVSRTTESQALQGELPDALSRWTWKAPPWPRCAPTSACRSRWCAPSPTVPTTPHMSTFRAFSSRSRAATARPSSSGCSATQRNQPRLRKYSIGTTAEAIIRAIANG